LARVPPLDQLPFTPLLTCEPSTSLLMSRFDWHVVPISAWVNGTSHCGRVDDLPWVNGTGSHDDPHTVWAAPHALPRLLELAEQRFDTKRADRVVVFSGTEMPLSVAFGRTQAERNATVARLRRYFARILYQTKDIEVEGVRIAPIGLSWGYMLRLLLEWLQENSGSTHSAVDRLATWGLSFPLVALSSKTRGVLAVASQMNSWLDSERTLQDLKVFAGQELFPRSVSNSSTRAVAAAWESRARLRAWARSPAARAAGVELRMLGAAEWWAALPLYRFLLAPVGAGVQTAKVVEALLTLTVPVVQRMGFAAYDELLALGFPIVLVRGWVEVTAENTSQWWGRLSPRLESFRRNCLTVDGFWRIYVGLLSICV